MKKSAEKLTRCSKPTRSSRTDDNWLDVLLYRCLRRVVLQIVEPLNAVFKLPLVGGIRQRGDAELLWRGGEFAGDDSMKVLLIEVAKSYFSPALTNAAKAPSQASSSL